MKRESAGKREHQIIVEKEEGQDVKRKRECGEPMERSKKSDEVLYANTIRVNAVTHTMQLLQKFRV